MKQVITSFRELIVDRVFMNSISIETQINDYLEKNKGSKIVSMVSHDRKLFVVFEIKELKK